MTLLADVRPEYLKMPTISAGMKVGLFGGSFNPPHEGHLLVAETALRRLKLDQLWWMVTPGNPLKDHSELASLSNRINQSLTLCGDRRIRVTCFEAAYRLNYTEETLDFIKRRHQNVHFVWVMGADNMAQFHKWQNWQKIARTFPIAVVDRPGSTLSYLSSRMAKRFSHARVDESDAGRLALMHAPSWTFLHGPRSSMSSTKLRNNHNSLAKKLLEN